MSIIRGMDQYEMVFTSLEELRAELKRREAATTRPVVHSSSIRFVTTEEAEVIGTVPNVLEELIEDTKSGSQLVVLAGSVPYLVAETSFNTIKGRIEINGPGFEKLTTKTRRLVINERFGQLDREVRLIVIDDKIRAILSAGTTQSYAVMPMVELVEELMTELENRFETPVMKGAVLGYNDLVTNFLFPGMKEELYRLYDLPDQWIPGIRVVTSDTGDAANAITPYWSKKGSSRGLAVQGEAIYQEHRGGVTVKAVIDQLPKLFSRFQNVAKWMTEAMTVEVDSPKAFITALGKHLGLSKRFVLSVLNVYDAYSRPSKTTAYTIVEHMFEALEEYDNSTSLSLENLVGKVFTINTSTLQKIASSAQSEAETIDLFSQLKLEVTV